MRVEHLNRGPFVKSALNLFVKLTETGVRCFDLFNLFGRRQAGEERTYTSLRDVVRERPTEAYSRGDLSL